jgi:flavin-dependent dehydrogenase
LSDREERVNGDRSTSEVEIAPIRPAAERYDAAILGGGLAGLTLAIQLKQERPATQVAILEKREGPAPLAAFKVGESTVIPGAHYFAEIVGMKKHLEEEQEIKCGLRHFLPTTDNADITARVEVGPRDFPDLDNYQVDRGLFENKLAARARVLGVDLLQGCRVQDVTFGSDLHEVNFTQFDQPASTHARWVVDAAGRASLLKRKLGLAAPCGHTINSAWFRLAGGLDLEQWGSHDERWMSRMKRPGIRQYSTNHLMGEGYWIWLIPLSTGPISIGVCADPRLHPFEQINDFSRMLEWLHTHEPQLATTVAARVDDIEDFLRVEDYAYGVTQTYSKDRWSLVGEAAAFADPLFSPGSDFIGYGNIFTADLIKRDLDGENIDERLTYYNELYQRTFECVIAKYRDMYHLWGNPWITSGWLGWSNHFNHTGSVSLMLRNKLADLEFMKSVEEDLDRMYRLNINMQKLFREWHQLDRERPTPAVRPKFMHIYKPPPLSKLLEAAEGDDRLREHLHRERQTLEALAVALFHRAAADLPEPPPTDRAINPYAVGLRPETWEADGIHEQPGLTLQGALQLATGFERIWQDPSAPMGPPPGPSAGEQTSGVRGPS